MLRRKVVRLPLIAAGAVAACMVALLSADQVAIRNVAQIYKHAVVKDSLDPESARFRGSRLLSLQPPLLGRLMEGKSTASPSKRSNPITGFLLYDPDSFVLCGEVNTKNAMGAYTGYKQFHVMGGPDQPHVFLDDHGSDNRASELCEISSNELLSGG